MELSLVVASGALMAIGLLLIVGVFSLGPHDGRARTRGNRRMAPKAIAGGVVGALVAVATGWVLPAVMLGVVGWWATGLIVDRADLAGDDLARVEAIATWTEQLRDVLMAGDQPIGAIQATVATAPEAIRPHVRALAARLGRQDEQVVLRQWADDLDDPTADLVAAGLLVALTRGGRAEHVLSSLAAQARQQAERRKLLEAERAPAKREVWSVTGLTTLQLIGGVLFARSDYLAPYRTATGQVVLCAFLAIFLGLILHVQRLSRFPRPARFLTLRASS